MDSIKWFIFCRGNVYSTFSGTDDEAWREIDRLNETDLEGSTSMLSRFSDKHECEKEFYSLIDPA